MLFFIQLATHENVTINVTTIQETDYFENVDKNEDNQKMTLRTSNGCVSRVQLDKINTRVVFENFQNRVCQATVKVSIFERW